jgi:hypothetical protein
MRRIELALIALTALAAAQSGPAHDLRHASAAELQAMAARFAPVDLKVDISHLSSGDRAALVKLIEAARIIDVLQLRQRWSRNERLWDALKADASPISRARLEYFWINKGPWSKLDGDRAFMGDFADVRIPDHYPAGGNFYPAGATREQLESWMKSLPEEDRDQAQGFFTVIRKGPRGRFRIVPYSEEYKVGSKRLARLLEEAAALTENASLKKFLTLRARAFLSNDYLESDYAWMDLDAPLDITIGPYETYNDELFGYKAAYEAYINVRDEKETAKLRFFGAHMQEIEDALPIPAEYRNKKVGAAAPMVVVNEVFGGGDGNMGIATVAYNLPNDERIISRRGSKRVMLKNIQRAKFEMTLIPIAGIVLAPADRAWVDFDSFFTHTIMHEVTHGLGPHVLTLEGRETTPRQTLKETYSTMEEAKADITGLFALQFLMDQGLLKDSLGQGADAERRLYTTYLASAFRTLHFGLTDAHARGMAIQFNFLLDHGGFVAHRDGTFSVDLTKIKQAVRDLDTEFLTIEATGDYARARKLMADLMVIRPSVQAALEKASRSVPNDIRPRFVTAEDLLRPAGRVPQAASTH